MTSPGVNALRSLQRALLPGRGQLVAANPFDPASADAYETALLEAEAARVAGVTRRREWRDGHQYDLINADRAAAERVVPGQRMPEHLRLHAYSTQISESVRHLSDRIASGWSMTATNPQVQAVIDAMVAATDEIAAEDDDGDLVMTCDEPLLDAMTAGDVAVFVGYDPIGADGQGTPYLEFWDSEYVRVVARTVTEWERVQHTQMVYRDVDGQGQPRVVTERRTYDLRTNPFGHREAYVTITWDGIDGVQDGSRWLGIGRLPWRLLRTGKNGLRTVRGESLISDQAIETAARLDAVEQVSWLVARYNSHSTLVVTGDAASAKVSKQAGLDRDIADLVTFPDDKTRAFALSLPTDPQMIEHQRGVLIDALYAKFGLVRMDPDSLQGLGGITGYALEILNERSESTISRVIRLWRRDWGGLIDLVLDVVAWSRAPLGLYDPATATVRPMPATTATPLSPAAVDADGADPTGPLPPGPGEYVVVRWWDVNPAQVYPDRQLRIEMGSGYVVDEAMQREDFATGLYSQRYVLRQRGLDDPAIDAIQEQQAAEAAARAARSPISTDGDVPPVEGGTADPIGTTGQPAGGGPATGPGSTIGSTTTGT